MPAVPGRDEAGTARPAAGTAAARGQDAAGRRRPTATRRCPAGHCCGVCGELVAAGTMEGMLTDTGWCHMAGCIVTVPPLPRAGAAGDRPRSAR
jgi:hypothetical protein